MSSYSRAYFTTKASDIWTLYVHHHLKQPTKLYVLLTKQYVHSTGESEKSQVTGFYLVTTTLAMPSWLKGGFSPPVPPASSSLPLY